ncbi:MAG TPA: DUF4336 domain-containing protein [Candidatus Binataceae bacterium]|nr:DUF4336 domain-containing protein [Candidatus Binataceae bacterium]
MPQPKNLASNLWVVDQPDFDPGAGRLGTRMTIVRLPNGGLFLHSPTKLDDETKTALTALGEVRDVVAPSRAHHLFVGDYAKAFPGAKLHAAPGIAGEINDIRAWLGARRDLKFDSILSDEPHPDWAGAIDQHFFRGASFLNEIVFFHPSSRTVMFTDLVFNIPADYEAANWFLKLRGTPGHFGPDAFIRLLIRDRAAAAKSVERTLRWDFDRVIVTHGDILESGGHAKIAEAFAYLTGNSRNP